MPCTTVPGSTSKNASREALRQRLASLSQFTTKVDKIVEALSKVIPPLLNAQEVEELEAIPDRIVDVIDHVVENVATRVEMLAEIAGVGGEKWPFYGQEWSADGSTTYRAHLKVIYNGDGELLTDGSESPEPWYISLPMSTDDAPRGRGEVMENPFLLRYPDFSSLGPSYSNVPIAGVESTEDWDKGFILSPDEFAAQHSNYFNGTPDVSGFCEYLEQYVLCMSQHMRHVVAALQFSYGAFLGLVAELDHLDIINAGFEATGFDTLEYTADVYGESNPGMWSYRGEEMVRSDVLDQGTGGY